MLVVGGHGCGTRTPSRCGTTRIGAPGEPWERMGLDAIGGADGGEEAWRNDPGFRRGLWGGVGVEGGRLYGGNAGATHHRAASRAVSRLTIQSRHLLLSLPYAQLVAVSAFDPPTDPRARPTRYQNEAVRVPEVPPDRWKRRGRWDHPTRGWLLRRGRAGKGLTSFLFCGVGRGFPDLEATGLRNPRLFEVQVTSRRRRRKAARKHSRRRSPPRSSWRPKDRQARLRTKRAWPGSSGPQTATTR